MSIPSTCGPDFLSAVRRRCRQTGHSILLRSHWIECTPSSVRLRPQGWKLHVSAGPEPLQILEACLGLLIEANVHFKVVRSADVLLELNAGAFGMSQVGKFITVYPDDARHAVSLARRLDIATRQGQGPGVPSDRPLRPGSLIHYRYGPFGDRHIQYLSGELEPAVRDRRGVLHGARAQAHYVEPEWVTNPFHNDDAAPRTGVTLHSGRYAVLHVLSQSARGTTALALDVRTPRVCVLKEARPWVTMGRDGTDARDRLRHEASVLEEIAPLGIAPRPYELFEHGRSLYLAMEDLDAVSLESQVASRLFARGLPANREIRRLGLLLAQTVAKLHARKLIHRDLKPANVVEKAGRLCLLDFELCLRAGSRAAWGIGSAGYMSPAQRLGGRASVADDVYAIGATLYFAATGADPATGPSAHAPLSRPLLDMNPVLSPSLAKTIGRCLAADPRGRPATAEGVRRALRRVKVDRPRLAARRRKPRIRNHGASVVRLIRTVVRDVSAGADLDSHYSLNDGFAGSVLVLSELVRLRPTRHHAAVLRRGCQQLVTHTDGAAGHQHAGLCIGQGGSVAAVFRAGRILGDVELTRWAHQRCQWILDQKNTGPDYFNGAAGNLWLGLKVEAQHRTPDLARAIDRQAEWLLDAREPEGGLWRIPPGHGGLSGATYYGFAHGAAGIGSTLLDVYETRPIARYLQAARGTARVLRRAAERVSWRRGALAWRTGGQDSMATGPFWCHGAAGVGSFFLQLARITRNRDALQTAVGAGRTVASAGCAFGPTQCHGLSGGIGFLLDLHRATGDAQWYAEAWRHAGLLVAYAEAATAAPDRGYFTGKPGMLAALLRLTRPSQCRNLLGEGFLATDKVAVPIFH